jgi:4'-phosphopantetheinyl transferase EntD
MAELLPPGVACAVTDPTEPVAEDEIFASEAAAMARAVPKRRAEFFAGRVAAHRAMQTLGLLPEPVPMGADRAPVWPSDTVGSISHCDGACVALVARADGFRALAVDIEPDADLPEDVIGMVCLPAERNWLDQVQKTDRRRMARRIFSAKETVFKLQYPITGKMLDFSDVVITFDVEPLRFEALVTAPIETGLMPGQLTGQIGQASGLEFCMMFAV